MTSDIIFRKTNFTVIILFDQVNIQLLIKYVFRTWAATGITADTQGTDGTEEFCARANEYECVSPNMPSCEDRTVVCDLSEIKQKEGLTLTDNTANNTRNNGSFGAKFTYGCEQDGKLVL